jgi:hypothetical protein
MSAYVFHFGGGATSTSPRSRDKTITGGKGANLAEMAGIGLPVPPGFTISTEVCTQYNASGHTFDDDLRAAVAQGIAHIEAATGRTFGDATNPLLVSVRSGARVSMPGMMDTVLNLGLNDATVAGLAAGAGDARFAWDSYRRKTRVTTPMSICRRKTGRRWSNNTMQSSRKNSGGRSRRTCTNSCGARLPRCSTAGKATAPKSIAG